MLFITCLWHWPVIYHVLYHFPGGVNGKKLAQSAKESPSDRLDAINAVLLDPNEQVINDFLKVVAKYGTPEEINRKHTESRQLPNLLKQVKAKNPDYIKDLEWLIDQRDRGAFTSVASYRGTPAGRKN